MTRYAKRKLKYSRNENFNLLPYVEWDRFVTLTSGMRVTLSYLGADNRKVTYYGNMELDLCG
jgi:hypothetical protein